jgi:hypothetical protein
MGETSSYHWIVNKVWDRPEFAKQFKVLVGLFRAYHGMQRGGQSTVKSMI